MDFCHYISNILGTILGPKNWLKIGFLLDFLDFFLKIIRKISKNN